MTSRESLTHDNTVWPPLPLKAQEVFIKIEKVLLYSLARDCQAYCAWGFHRGRGWPLPLREIDMITRSNKPAFSSYCSCRRTKALPSLPYTYEGRPSIFSRDGKGAFSCWRRPAPLPVCYCFLSSLAGCSLLSASVYVCIRGRIQGLPSWLLHSYLFMSFFHTGHASFCEECYSLCLKSKCCRSYTPPNMLTCLHHR